MDHLREIVRLMREIKDDDCVIGHATLKLEIDRSLFLGALAKFGWSKIKTAKYLRINRTTLIEWLKKNARVNYHKKCKRYALVDSIRGKETVMYCLSCCRVVEYTDN